MLCGEQVSTCTCVSVAGGILVMVVMVVMVVVVVVVVAMVVMIVMDDLETC